MNTPVRTKAIRYRVRLAKSSIQEIWNLFIKYLEAQSYKACSNSNSMTMAYITIYY